MRDRRPPPGSPPRPLPHPFPRPSRGQRPIVTLITDFGVSDHYVAAMKAVRIREFPLVPVESIKIGGRIIHIDHFGNATTNIRQDLLREQPGASIKVNRRSVGKLRRTCWDVAPGKPLALIGSGGLLEIAVRDGSARDDLKIRVGDEVAIR